MTAPELNAADRTELARLVRQLSVVFGQVTLSSGKEADYYVDLRRATLHHQAAPLIGRLMRELTADWDYAAVGGLTMGADPVACAVMRATMSSTCGASIADMEDPLNVSLRGCVSREIATTENCAGYATDRTSISPSGPAASMMSPARAPKSAVASGLR